MGGLEEVFVKEAFDTNWIAPLGANVDGFEKELSEYVGSKTGAALSSGTAAIHMALKAVGVEKGDKVFCSSLTFAASCNPIIYEGGIPVFIDSEPESHNMSPVALEKAFKAYEEKEEMPKAVIVVNLYGQSADMDKIIEICKKYNVPIIEDAAESLGATYKGKHSGTFGEYGVYSFNGNKIITTSGGGMLVSNNKEGIAKVRFWSTQARDKARHYEHTELGYNYRMSNIVAGIGRGQLRVLEYRIAKKKEIFETYKEAFKDIEDIEMMPVCEYGEPNYWLTTITLNENSKVKPLDIILALEKQNIEARPIWKPMHIQPYYKEYDFYSHNDDDEISVSEDIFNRGICLPSDTKMSDHDMDRVIGIIKNLFQKEINEIDSKKEVLV
ncbi:DegT/DnrJ/EryC1/StrS family aminotransferase [Clostridium perfringens]|uniref:DegT/DnrJ/EryC1/StrS family aminotransferase n=1 Tax=Clostridium perfringens TaxID=1502 RepID=UPI0024BCFBEF|nr:aminotransferase class I/II-fold pyridoxal phosphate-dependent enzyme [Clostridium perfringens]